MNDKLSHYFCVRKVQKDAETEQKTRNLYIVKNSEIGNPLFVKNYVDTENEDVAWRSSAGAEQQPDDRRNHDKQNFYGYHSCGGR